MRGRHLSLVLLVPTVLAIGTAQASSIDQSPRRFASFSSPYVLPTAVGSIGTLDLPSSPDNWLGGTGNWSNGADWSSGLPGSNDDVSINTGNDNVTLDTSSSINSLTLGGTGGSSRLTGDGNAHTLTIAGALTINQSGNLYLSDDTMTAGASSTNLGTASLEFGSSLQINGDVNNSATLNMGQGLSSSNNSLNVTGTLTNTGTVNIGHFSFTSIGGGTATVGGLSNSGTINLGGESTLQVNGNATNSGVVSLDVSTALSVTGNLINSGTLEILSDDNGIAGQVSIVGTLTNTSTGLVMVGGDVARATVGTLVNQGAIGIDAGFASSAVFAIAGDATNSGSIGFGSEGTNHLTVGGALTNNAGATLALRIFPEQLPSEAWPTPEP